MSAHDVPDLAYGDAPDSFDSPDGRTHSGAAPTPGQAPGSLHEMPEYAKWRGWLAEENYDFDDDSYQAEAFLAGMNAARDLAAQEPETAPELDLVSDEMRPGELDAVLAAVPPCEEISPWGMRCRVVRAHETHRDRDGNMWWPERELTSRPAPGLAAATADLGTLADDLARGEGPSRKETAQRIRAAIERAGLPS